MAVGEVDARSVISEPIESRFERFVDAVYRRQVVPLLGAGASVGSVAPARELVPRLESLVRPLPIDGLVGREAEEHLDLVAEAAIRAHGYRKTCDALEITAMAGRDPNSAHRYLARLAADGLVSKPSKRSGGSDVRGGSTGRFPTTTKPPVGPTSRPTRVIS